MVLVEMYFLVLVHDETIPIFQQAFCEQRVKSS